ncbi:hypothetical protein CC78DRAFT_347213 [Lojkania enalia]|uniref:Uncharacterized protein n=1 Tax=Lojkania enalia TaxID=147567 RepID=A0A9P4N0Q7_9PLEO|nr:hypothetical protein CC78DRAFT_347213 [Didymosphaeria enalia]
MAGTDFEHILARDMNLASAIKTGLLENYIDPSNVTGFCPDERCDWLKYQTLAICSDVEEVPSLLVPSTSNDNSPSVRAGESNDTSQPFDGIRTVQVKPTYHYLSNTRQQDVSRTPLNNYSDLRDPAHI